MLRRGRLTRHVTVPLSAALPRDTAGYIDTLTAYRQGQPEEIVAGFADAAFVAVVNGRTLVHEVRSIRTRWDEVVRVRRGATAWRIADLLLRRAVLDGATVAAELGIAGQNVYRSIHPLVDAGVVHSAVDRLIRYAYAPPERVPPRPS